MDRVARLVYDPPGNPGRPRGRKVSAVVYPEPPALMAAGSLVRNTAPLTRKQAVHLLRRAAFGGSVTEVKEYEGMPADEAAKKLVQEALAAPIPDPPEWASHYPPWNGSDSERRAYNDLQFEWAQEYASSWVDQMVRVGLREKLVLFWHSHFVTERDTYFYTIMAHQYVTHLRTWALGNFKKFVIQTGVNPAMLVYLDGRLSTRTNPNENYARELLELFTMGQLDSQGRSNYTQADIVELSRALTGWQVDYGRFTTNYDRSRADRTEKEIFGRRDTFNYISLHDWIFEARTQQIADFIVRRLYREFVYQTPNAEVAGGLAKIFVENDFEIAPVVEAILASRHFYAEEVMGARIKSPTELVLGLMKDIGSFAQGEPRLRRVHRGLRDLDQHLLNPPNVAGWPGYRSWVSTSSLPARWDEVDFMVRTGIAGRPLNLVPATLELLDADDPLVAFKAPVALAEHFLSVPLTQLSLDAPEEFAGDLESRPIPQEIMEGPAYVRNLAKIFLGSQPWYSWNPRRPGIAYGMTRYLLFLSKLPEYQLG